MWVYTYIYTAGTDYESTVEWLDLFVYSQVTSYPQWSGLIHTYMGICIHCRVTRYTSGYTNITNLAWLHIHGRVRGLIHMYRGICIHCEVARYMSGYIYPSTLKCLHSHSGVASYIHIYVWIYIYIYTAGTDSESTVEWLDIYSCTLKWLHIHSGVAWYICIGMYASTVRWLDIWVAMYIHPLCSAFISTVEWLDPSAPISPFAMGKSAHTYLNRI